VYCGRRTQPALLRVKSMLDLVRFEAMLWNKPSAPLG